MTWHSPDEDDMIYKVVVNDEEQYSLWPADRLSPPGWREVGKEAARAECLAYIKEVWTDMRPLSLRRQMEQIAQRRVSTVHRQPTEPSTTECGGGDDLVGNLTNGEHPVEIGPHGGNSVEEFRQSIERGYVYIRFRDTKGGTELSLRLDANACDLSKAEFSRAIGHVHLQGELTLNYIKVRCLADIDLSTLTGKGRLAPFNLA